MLKPRQTANTTITGYTSEGEGVCRIDGCAVFVPNAIRGELCTVSVCSVGKTAARGRLEKLIWRSFHRTSRDCPYAKRCGGCQLWHMDYAEELRFKAQKVKDALTRIGGQSVGDLDITGGDGKTVSLSALIAADEARKPDDEPSAVFPKGEKAPWPYRNKAQFPVQRQWSRPTAGFYQQGTHTVVPIERCLIQDPAADAVKKLVMDWAQQYRVSAYEEEDNTGLLRHIYVRKGAVTSQVMVCLVTNGEKIPHLDELISRLRRGVPGLSALIQCVNTKRTNVILTDDVRTLYGRDYIEDVLCGFTFRLSARSFYQVNHDQAERLYEKAIEFADLRGTETVLDLYCGTGTITLTLSRKAKKVFGVEVVPQAIADAKENAARNSVENVEFFCADAGEAASRFAKSLPFGTSGGLSGDTSDSVPQTAPKSLPLEGKVAAPEAQTDEVLPNDRPVGIDVIVVDPPRKGLAPDVIEAIAVMAPARVVYVSCDPATLARDVKLLTEKGYAMTKAEAFDLFPRTFHVETVVSLSQLKSEV